MTENPKNLKIVPVVAAQTPRVLPDVAASVINNGVAIDAGLVLQKILFSMKVKQLRRILISLL